MNVDLQRAISSWQAEVDYEAARLIESGVAPYDAIEQARKNVSERRKRNTQRKLQDMLDA